MFHLVPMSDFAGSGHRITDGFIFAIGHRPINQDVYRSKDPLLSVAWRKPAPWSMISYGGPGNPLCSVPNLGRGAPSARGDLNPSSVFTIPDTFWGRVKGPAD